MARLAQAGDARHRQRIQELTTTHGAFLLGLARKLCGTTIDPDDLVQDLMEKLIRTQPLPDMTHERAWLGRVVHNLFVDKLRRLHARREDLVDEPVEPSAEDRAWWEALSEDAVRAAAAQLPADQRETFARFAFDGWSYDRIAAELGIAKATVGTRILRARQKIRAVLTAAEEGA